MSMGMRSILEQTLMRSTCECGSGHPHLLWCGFRGYHIDIATCFFLALRITYGTEEGRNGSHEDHWPLWSIVSLTAQNGSISSTLKASGAFDWGRAYAVTYMPVTTGGRNRIVAVGWTYVSCCASPSLTPYRGKPDVNACI